MRDGWSTSTIGDVAEVLSGFAFKSDLFSESEGMPLIRIRDLPKRSKTEAFYSGDFEDRYVVRKGDFLIGMDGEFHCYEWTGANALLNQRVCRIQGFKLDRVLPRFIYFSVNQHLEKIEQDTGYTTVKHISAKQVLGIQIPLPPLPEQERIVDLISTIDSYIEALQEQLERAKKSRNAILHELLTAGGDDDWIRTTLGEVSELNPEQAKDFDSDRLIRYVDLSSVNFDSGIDETIEPIVFSEAPGRARRIIRDKDVIVSTVRPYLKGFAIVDSNFDGEIASTGFCVIRANPETLSPFLVWAIVSSDDFVQYLIGRSTGSSYPAVRPSDISEYSIFLPPRGKQEVIGNLIFDLDQMARNTVSTIHAANAFRSGVLSDLLSGAHEIPTSYDKVMVAI
jgi:type I restriction enzyme S subunit